VKLCGDGSPKLVVGRRVCDRKGSLKGLKDWGSGGRKKGGAKKRKKGSSGGGFALGSRKGKSGDKTKN